MYAALAVIALLASTPPAPTRWVEDRAAFLSPGARETLDAKLAGYQQATGHQVVVWIDKTLQGAALDDWAARTFEAWRLGRQGSDDGLAIFIFAEDRTIDIEVGYGLEDKVPDAVASRIIREVMTPRLQAGDRDAAVAGGVDAVLAAIEGKAWTGTPATAPPAMPTWLYVVFGIIVVLLFIKFPRVGMMVLWSFMGRGGGGGGGFSPGGGRSGGGGARGKW